MDLLKELQAKRRKLSKELFSKKKPEQEVQNEAYPGEFSAEKIDFSNDKYGYITRAHQVSGMSFLQKALINNSVYDMKKYFHAFDGLANEPTFNTFFDKEQQQKVLNHRDINGKTALHYAIEKGNVTVFNRLLNRGVDVNLPDNMGQTPLHYLAKMNFNRFPDEKDREIYKHMAVELSKRANLLQQDDKGRDAFTLSKLENNSGFNLVLSNALNSRKDEVKNMTKVVQYEKIQKLKETALKKSPSIWIQAKGIVNDYQEPKTKQIVNNQKEAQVNFKNENTQSLLDLLKSKYSRFDDSIKKVMGYVGLGADLKAQDRDGNTALHLAVASRDPKLVDFIANREVDFNLKNNKQETAFDIAKGQIDSPLLPNLEKALTTQNQKLEEERLMREAVAEMKQAQSNLPKLNEPKISLLDNVKFTPKNQNESVETTLDHEKIGYEQEVSQNQNLAQNTVNPNLVKKTNQEVTNSKSHIGTLDEELGLVAKSTQNEPNNTQAQEVNLVNQIGANIDNANTQKLNQEQAPLSQNVNTTQAKGQTQGVSSTVKNNANTTNSNTQKQTQSASINNNVNQGMSQKEAKTVQDIKGKIKTFENAKLRPPEAMMKHYQAGFDEAMYMNRNYSDKAKLMVDDNLSNYQANLVKFQEVQSLKETQLTQMRNIGQKQDGINVNTNTTINQEKTVTHTKAKTQEVDPSLNQAVLNDLQKMRSKNVNANSTTQANNQNANLSSKVNSNEPKVDNPIGQNVRKTTRMDNIEGFKTALKSNDDKLVGMMQKKLANGEIQQSSPVSQASAYKLDNVNPLDLTKKIKR